MGFVEAKGADLRVKVFGEKVVSRPVVGNGESQAMQKWLHVKFEQERDLLAQIERDQSAGLLPSDVTAAELLERIRVEELKATLPYNVLVKVVDPEVYNLGLPKYAKEGDAGSDLFCCLAPKDREKGVTIEPGQRVLVPTGIALQLPPGHWAKLCHRSSTEYKKKLRVVQGTIDHGFRGSLFIHAHNNSNDHPIVVEHGARVGQLVIARLVRRGFVEVSELDDSDRGLGGFGHTGG